MFSFREEVSAVDHAGGSGSVTVVGASGELDLFAAPHLTKSLERHAAGPALLVVDLTEVTFIDSSAIGALVGTATRLRERGGALAVVCAPENGRVRRIFDIVGIAEIVPVYGTREHALTAVLCPSPRDDVSPLHDLSWQRLDGNHSDHDAMSRRAIAISRYTEASRLG
jgi:anti-sigma B factor antagonist